MRNSHLWAYESGCSQGPTTAYTDHSCKGQRRHVNVTVTKTRVCSSTCVLLTEQAGNLNTSILIELMLTGQALVPGGCGQHFGVWAEVAEADRSRIANLTAKVVEILKGKGKICCWYPVISKFKITFYFQLLFWFDTVEVRITLCMTNISPSNVSIHHLTLRLLCSSCCLITLVASATSFWTRAVSSRFTALSDQSQDKFIRQRTKQSVSQLRQGQMKWAIPHRGREYLASQMRASFRKAAPSWYHVCWHCEWQKRLRVLFPELTNNLCKCLSVCWPLRVPFWLSLHLSWTSLEHPAQLQTEHFAICCPKIRTISLTKFLSWVDVQRREYMSRSHLSPTTETPRTAY